MDANHSPPMRLKRLKVAEVLRLVQHRKVVRCPGYRNGLAIVLCDLQEQSGVGSTLVQLAGRVQEARAVTERGRDAVALDHRFADRGDLLVDGGIRRQVRHRSEVVARLCEVQEFAHQSAKILITLQRADSGAAGVKRKLALFRNWRQRWKLLALFEFGQ